MPKYLFQASYTQAGLQGLLKEGGTSRRDNLNGVIEASGGKMEAFYYAFGEDDVFVIVDLPDDASASAIALTVAASGAVSLKTTVLVTPETVDEAVKKAVSYRPPGG